MARSRRETSTDDWTSEISSGFALAGFLTLVLVAVTLLAIGPLAKFDAYFNLAPPPPSLQPTLVVLDRIGQRAVCLPILAVATFFACRRQESWRPAVIAGVSVFALNLVVLILKVTLGRGTPVSADPTFFVGGMAYPSGHSANVVLVYGLVVYFLLRYSRPSRPTRWLLWALVPVLSVVMVYTSLTLNWHWFTDLVAGLLVGGVVLQTAATTDRLIVAKELAPDWRQVLRELPGTVRGGLRGERSRGPVDPA